MIVPSSCPRIMWPPKFPGRALSQSGGTLPVPNTIKPFAIFTGLEPRKRVLAFFTMAFRQRVFLALPVPIN